MVCAGPDERETGAMVTITVSERIAAPSERVFALFTDLEHAAENIEGIVRLELLTPGPVGVGTRFRETRVFMKKEATEEMEVTALERGRGYTVECTSHGAHYTTDFRFSPDGSETEVVATFHVEPLSFFAKMLKPLAGMMASGVRKCIEQDMADLKRKAEGGA
jgi:carbon monoxide dehydrogenase subunit G